MNLKGVFANKQKIMGGLGGSDIHAVIYTYYALSGFGPSVRPYLWWKKYLTSLQLVSCEPQGGLCKQKKLWGGGQNFSQGEKKMSSML